MGAPVKSGDNPRRAAFLQRMGAAAGPQYKNGKKTPLLKSLNIFWIIVYLLDLKFS